MSDNSLTLTYIYYLNNFQINYPKNHQSLDLK